MFDLQILTYIKLIQQKNKKTFIVLHLLSFCNDIMSEPPEVEQKN